MKRVAFDRAGTVLVCALWLAPAAGLGQGMVDAMRGPVPLNQEPPAPPLQNQENKDVRRTRAFAMQPPTIPHRIDGYQIDRFANRCMACHARSKIEESKAIPVSATHYMDRDGTIRGDISPRRYFCTTCHVPQDEVKPLIANRYEDFEAVRARESTSRPGGAAAAKK
jgi:nitrate reductase (cytochrome), electron transfer subunit